MNEDDYGMVLPPEGLAWQPPSNHANGSFYGLEGWATAFCSLLESHPLYVDPNDALAGRYMYLLSRMRKSNWPPEFDYAELRPDQERYGIISGIGNDQHFAPDHDIGLALGWGGLLEKVRRCRRQHGPEKAAFFQAEEDVILAVQHWIRRTVAAIEEAESRETDATLRENLQEMAEANRWLIDKPPVGLGQHGGEDLQPLRRRRAARHAALALLRARPGRGADRRRGRHLPHRLPAAERHAVLPAWRARCRGSRSDQPPVVLDP
jgi:formate C-acetyltransferase